MKYYYYQLLAPNYDDLVKGNDNPACIADGTHLATAKKIARDWLKEANVKEAVLVRNVVANDCDNIERIIEINL